MEHKQIAVYIASPYTNGDSATNVRVQMDMGDILIRNGFFPFIPLLYHFQQMVHPNDYYTWLSIDEFWIKRCDCLLRLDGESNGADFEVSVAIKNNIPVFYNLNDLVNYYKNNI